MVLGTRAVAAALVSQHSLCKVILGAAADREAQRERQARAVGLVGQPAQQSGWKLRRASLPPPPAGDPGRVQRCTSCGSTALAVNPKQPASGEQDGGCIRIGDGWGASLTAGSGTAAGSRQARRLPATEGSRQLQQAGTCCATQPANSCAAGGTGRTGSKGSCAPLAVEAAQAGGIQGAAAGASSRQALLAVCGTLRHRQVRRKGGRSGGWGAGGLSGAEIRAGHVQTPKHRMASRLPVHDREVAAL
jgi:hypothetical protein